MLGETGPQMDTEPYPLLSFSQYVGCVNQRDPTYLSLIDGVSELAPARVHSVEVRSPPDDQDARVPFRNIRLTLELLGGEH